MAELESQGQKKSVSESKTYSFSPLWMIVTMIALVVASVAVIMIIVGAQNYQRIRQEISVQKDNVQKLQANQQTLDVLLTQQQQAITSALAGLEQFRLSNNKDRLGPVLVEVDYLVRLAHYNAQYVGDAKVALALLETAEQRISALSSPQLADVRGALVTGITTLKGVKPVDIEGILLRLNSLSNLIVDLPVVQQAATVEVAKSSETPSTAQSSSSWKEKFIQSLEELKKVVVVHHLSEPVKPLMGPEQHTNLVENIQLKIASAQWALLHREPKIYSVALNQAKEWIGQYFVQNKMTQAVVEGLSELDKIEIKPSLPDLTSTVAVIDQAIQIHQAAVANTSSSGASFGATPPSANLPAAGATGAPTSGPLPAPGSNEAPTPADGKPTPATPPKAKPQNPTEPEVISS